MRRPPETVPVLGSYASLACPEIRSRGAAGSSGEASPPLVYHPLSLPNKFFHTQTHTSLRLQFFFCFLLFFLSGKCASATLLFQIQSNHNTKRLKSYSMSGANYKKNDRTKTKREREEGSRTRIQSEEAKHLKGLPDGERVLQLWLTSSLVVKSH